MDWRLAKNLAIFFLIILNIFLIVLIYANKDLHTLSSSQEKSIYKLLSQNKINLYDDIIREYKPMKQLLFSDYTYDTDKLLNTFFKKPREAKVSLEYEKTIYSSLTETLIVQKGSLAYETIDNTRDFNNFTRTDAIALCDEYMKKLSDMFPGFSVDVITEDENIFTVQYRQNYEGFILQSNFFVFNITRDGKIQITSNYSNPVDFKKIERDIYSSDVALYIFIQHMNNLYGDKEVFVNKMDIVYLQTALTAEPYYRFYISDVDIPVLINAYTGAISKEGLFN